MIQPLTFNARIIEALYTQALTLSDDVRAAFTLADHCGGVSGQGERWSPRPKNWLKFCETAETGAPLEDPDRVALSSEGLRTATRMMHSVAWLLNHRAFLQGSISAYQLARFGRLSPDMGRCDEAHLARLSPSTAALVQQTRRFYDQLLRLDGQWRSNAAPEITAIALLREKIEGRLAG